MSYNIKDYTPFREGKHPVFSSSENGCRHIGNNVSRQYIRHFKIDGEVFRSSGEERCDYLLVNDDAKTSYYIELKGSDLSKAIRQIENTIKLIAPSLSGYAVFSQDHISYRFSQCPRIRCFALESKAQSRDKGKRIFRKYLTINNRE